MRNESMNKTKICILHYFSNSDSFLVLDNLNLGKIFSRFFLSGSSHLGNIRRAPSSDDFWSTVKPGGSVAISNRTPPGSLKYTEWKYIRSIIGVALRPALIILALRDF